MTGSFQFSLLFSCIKGIYILLLNKAYSQLTLGYSRTTALILVTAPILFIYSVECHRGVAPVPPQTFVYKSLTKNFIFFSYPVFAAEPNSVQLQAGVFAP